MSSVTPKEQLEALGLRLRDLYSRILEVEREFQSHAAGLALLGHLTNDPAWAWLRPLSRLIADIDHVLAGPIVDESEIAVAAGRSRGF